MTSIPTELAIDPAVETERLVLFIRQKVRKLMHRSGGVVGISGGIDSSVVLALCMRAFGKEYVAAIFMPEKDSEPESEMFARLVADRFEVSMIREDITPVLDGFGCYQRRDEAIRRLFPEFDPDLGYKCKIGLPQDILEQDTLSVFSLTIVTPDGIEKKCRLPLKDYLQIVAASNFKQRSRMAMLYYHAELRNYAVIGTANKNEHDQGFFVKYGDGGADMQPIAHLYKTQVYQLASYLGVPEAIQSRTPTTDTYSAPTSQQEFFFRLSFEMMDHIWSLSARGQSAAQIAGELGLNEIQAERAINELNRKQHATEYLRLPPILFNNEHS